MKDEHTAKVNGTALNISTKKSIEICSFIRNKNLQEAKKMSRDVISFKRSVPFRRFNADLGHKKGKEGPASYPIKAAKGVTKLLESVEANAQFKGLGKDLVIKHIKADLASRPWHSGRQRRRKMKRTNIEIIVEESVEEKKKEVKKDVKDKREIKEKPKKEETKEKEIKLKKEEEKKEEIK